MTLTIELPQSVADRAAEWSRDELSQIAVDAVVSRLLEQDDMTGMTEMFNAEGESVGFYGPVTEEIPMDDATIAALKESRADHDAGRHYTTEEVRAYVMASLDDWEAKRNGRK